MLLFNHDLKSQTVSVPPHQCSQNVVYLATRGWFSLSENGYRKDREKAEDFQTCWWENNTKTWAVGGKGQWEAFSLNVNTQSVLYTESFSITKMCLSSSLWLLGASGITHYGSTNRLSGSTWSTPSTSEGGVRRVKDKALRNRGHLQHKIRWCWSRLSFLKLICQ